MGSGEHAPERRGGQLRLVREDRFAFDDRGDGDDGWVYLRRPDGTLDSLKRAVGGFDAGLSLGWYASGVLQVESEVWPGVVHRYREWHPNGVLAVDGDRRRHDDGTPAAGRPAQWHRVTAAGGLARAVPEISTLERGDGVYRRRGVPYSGRAVLFSSEGVVAASFTIVDGVIGGHGWWEPDGTSRPVTDPDAELARLVPGRDPRSAPERLGHRVTRHRNGIVRTRRQTVLGLPHGERREFHADGTLAAEHRLVLGRRRGRWRRWYPNGVLAEEGEVGADGAEVRHGAWHENGKERRQRPDRVAMGADGLRRLAAPEQVVPGPDGLLRLDDEVYSGEIVEDGRDGLVRSLMRVDDGRPHGAHLRWYDSGWLAHDSVWEHGRLVRRDRWPDR